MIGGEQPGAAGTAKRLSGWEPRSEALPSLKPQTGQDAEGLQNSFFFPSSGQPVVSELYEGKG